jgi:phosphatidylglycerophosphatase A
MVVEFTSRFIFTLATWFGCGKSPKAPGTAGTIGAIPLAWAVSQMMPFGQMLFIFSFTVAAIAVAHFHELSVGTHDNQEVVIDEVAGFLVTMLWIPFTWPYVLLGFALFRLLDVWKPFPISYVDQRVEGGIGVVGDDLIAGILSNVVLQVIFQRGWLV